MYVYDNKLVFIANGKKRTRCLKRKGDYYTIVYKGNNHYFDYNDLALINGASHLSQELLNSVTKRGYKC